VPGYATIRPCASAAATYQELYALYKNLYFALGERQSPAAPIGNILPELRLIAARAREGIHAGSVAS
jgi:L-ribulokinase